MRESIDGELVVDGDGMVSRTSSGVELKEPSVRAIFLRRMRTWTRDLARNAPASLLADALARPSARGAIVHVLNELNPSAEESESARLRERAVQRALAVREQLREEAGGFHDTAWVASHLGIRRQSVDKRRKEGSLLALESARVFEFPACQFTPDGTVPGLKEALGALDTGSFWETLAGLLTPAPALGGRNVLHALQAARTDGERQRVIEIAHAFKEQ